MSNTIIEQDHLEFPRGVGKLKAEVAVQEAGLTDLEQQNLRSSVLVQKLGCFFGVGPAGKLEWARFKLDFKQEELDQFRVEEKPEVTAVRYASSIGRIGETTRQKMERMITENPAELEPHIRRVYKLLIEAGNEVSGKTARAI